MNSPEIPESCEALNLGRSAPHNRSQSRFTANLRLCKSCKCASCGRNHRTSRGVENVGISHLTVGNPSNNRFSSRARVLRQQARRPTARLRTATRRHSGPGLATRGGAKAERSESQSLGGDGLREGGQQPAPLTPECSAAMTRPRAARAIHPPRPALRQLSGAQQFHNGAARSVCAGSAHVGGGRSHCSGVRGRRGASVDFR